MIKIPHNGLLIKLSGEKKIYLVGGSVRDFILGRKIKDYDFAVEGSGFRFAGRFAKKIRGTVVPLSEAEDEIRIHFNDLDFDFRGFEKRIDDDLRRRDFTINAIGYDLKTKEFYDPFKGCRDLEDRVLRLVTDDSLKLDPLRVLRGFRFAVEIGLEIDPKFFEQAKGISLVDIAKERIWMELSRILKQRSYKIIKWLDDLGVVHQIIPEIIPLRESPYWSHSLRTLRYTEEAIGRPIAKALQPEYDDYLKVEYRIPVLKLVGLLHDIAKPQTRFEKEGEVHFYGHDALGSRIVRKIGKEDLRLSNVETDMLASLVKEHMRPHLLAGSDLTDRAIRRFLRDLDEDFIGAMILAWADGKATAGKTRHLTKLYKKIINFYRIEKEKAAFKRLINGYDLIELGLKPGPIFKKILNEVEEQQRDGEIKTRDEALDLAERLIKGVVDR